MSDEIKKKSIIIGGVETFSTVDFPNKIAAAVFMQGCPWRCPFCYNTHLQPFEDQSGFVWEKFIEFLKKRQGILEGVVFSGGEPLAQDAVEDAIKEVKALGYTIGLHTGGYRPILLEKLLPYLSWVGFDIKAPFEEERFNEAIGYNPKSKIQNPKSTLTEVLKSFDMVISSGVDFECRTTCDPRILEIEDIYTIAKSLKEKGVKNYHLQQYRPIPSDTTTQESDCEKFLTDKALKTHLEANFQTVEFRK